MDLVSEDVKLVGVREEAAEEEGQTIGALLDTEAKRDKGRSFHSLKCIVALDFICY